MCRIINLLFFFVFIISLQVYSQDSVKIYLLSQKVGSEVDTYERAQYSIFEKYKNEFISCFFFEGQNGFYVHLSLKNGSNITSTIEEYRFTSFLNSAKRVQTFESGNLVTDPVILYIDTVIYLSKMFKKSGGDTTKKTTVTEILRLKEEENVDKVLPFADSDINVQELLKDEFQFYLSLGPSYKFSGLKDLNKIYNTFEQNLPFEKPRSLSNSEYTPGVLVGLGLSAVYRDFLMADLKFNFSLTGKQTADNLDYKSFRASLGYRYKFENYIYPYLSAGYARTYFHYNRSYFVNIMENDYPRQLQSIETEGTSEGVDITGGFIWEAADIVCFNFSVGYRFMGDISLLQYPDFNTRVNTGGWEAGISIMIR